MNPSSDTTTHFRALDALCDEFLRVARAASRERRRHRLQRIALALVVAVIVVPVGFALAQEGGSNETESTGEVQFTVTGPLNPSQLPPGVTLRPGIAELWSSKASHDDLNTIGSAPPPENFVQECRADLKAEGDCGIVLAMAEGKLAPGSYTDKELQAAVRAAGYDWNP
jgi:hypothetical protein